MQNYQEKLSTIAAHTKNVQEAATEKDVAKLANHAKNHNNENKANSGYRADETASQILQDTTKKLIAQSTAYRESLAEMIEIQADMISQSKKMTQDAKNYCNQVGEAMARIDKVIVKDFENKLNMLERFVFALKEMESLEKSGALEKIKKTFIS